MIEKLYRLALQPLWQPLKLAASLFERDTPEHLVCTGQCTPSRIGRLTQAFSYDAQVERGAAKRANLAHQQQHIRTNAENIVGMVPYIEAATDARVTGGNLKRDAIVFYLDRDIGIDMFLIDGYLAVADGRSVRIAAD